MDAGDWLLSVSVAGRKLSDGGTQRSKSSIQIQREILRRKLKEKRKKERREQKLAPLFAAIKPQPGKRKRVQMGEDDSSSETDSERPQKKMRLTPPNHRKRGISPVRDRELEEPEPKRMRLSSPRRGKRELSPLSDLELGQPPPKRIRPDPRKFRKRGNSDFQGAERPQKRRRLSVSETQRTRDIIDLTRNAKKMKYDAVTISEDKPARVDMTVTTVDPEFAALGMTEADFEKQDVHAVHQNEYDEEGNLVKDFSACQYMTLLWQLRQEFPREYKSKTKDAWYMAILRWCTKNEIQEI